MDMTGWLDNVITGLETQRLEPVVFGIRANPNLPENA